MKNFLVIAALVLGFAATANAGRLPTQSDSWSKILKNYNVKAFMPQYALSHGYFFRATEVCVDGDTLRSIKVITTCARTEGQDDECVAWKKIIPTKAMTGSRRWCVQDSESNGDCLEYRDVPYTIATDFDVTVRKSVQGEDNQPEDGEFLFKKEFSLPACK